MRHLFALLSVLLLAACSVPTTTPPKDEPSSSSVMMEEEDDSDEMAEDETEEVEDDDEDDDEKMAAQVITVNVDNWSFSPAAITAKKGDNVSLRLMGVSGAHGLAIPGFGISVPLSAGETKTVTLPTDTEGTFEFFCNVPCGSGHRDMRGTITIE